MPKCLVTMLSNPDRKRIIHMNRSRSAAPRTPLASTTLNVTITDLVAEYVLRHSFENDGSAPIAAVFTFPVPLDAAFVGLRATIAGETLCAQIQAKRSEEHKSELQSLMRISYAVFCLKKKKQHYNNN